MSKSFWCKNCLMPSTRPRIQFSKRGWCNACEWHEVKMSMDWSTRENRLHELCDQFRRHDGQWDCIVPASGGKDSTYVYYKMLEQYKMHPVALTCRCLIPSRIGKINLENFILSGVDHIMISPNPEKLRAAAKKGFVEQGRIWHAFDTMISTIPVMMAIKLDIPLIMLGEEGEIEYSGAGDAKEKVDLHYLRDYYYSGHDPSEYGRLWKMPTEQELDKIYLTHYSKFEDWCPEVHAIFAKNKCGLEMTVGGGIGTFTNWASLDDLSYPLHHYQQFTKFGFGRCAKEGAIEVRRGRMSRKQCVEVCKKIDADFPLELLPVYLDYLEMTEKEFWQVIDRWIDYDILYKTGIIEQPYRLKDEYANYDTFMPDSCDGVNFKRGKFSSV